MMDTGDTAWVLVATALVILMTQQVWRCFYGGLSNKKNVMNTVGMVICCFCTATCLVGSRLYSIAFRFQIWHPVLDRENFVSKRTFNWLEQFLNCFVAPSRVLRQLQLLLYVVQ
jgi:ammonia channel protein AmtB